MFQRGSNHQAVMHIYIVLLCIIIIIVHYLLVITSHQ